MYTFFRCSVCLSEKHHTDEHTTGYGTSVSGGKVCYDCCATLDSERLKAANKGLLYLTQETPFYGFTRNAHVSNWPGTFKIPAVCRKGKHNIAGVRYDVWFNFDGSLWHGVTYGDMTQICHVKRTTKTAAQNPYVYARG